MRYVRGLLLGVCLVLAACGIGEQQRIRCSMCSFAKGPFLIVHLNPPISENVIFELKRDNEKTIEIDCERFLFPSPIPKPGEDPFFGLDLNPYEPQGACHTKLVAETEEASSKSPASKTVINRLEVLFNSAYKSFNFSNEKHVEASLKTQSGQMLAQQKFTLNYKQSDNQCGGPCSQVEITLNLTDTESNPQEGAQ